MDEPEDFGSWVTGVVVPGVVLSPVDICVFPWVTSWLPGLTCCSTNVDIANDENPGVFAL